MRHDRSPVATAERLAGAIWGHLVGDAMGVPYEFRSAAQVGEVVFGATGSHGQPPGTWSDDGALMLASLDSLLHAGPGGTAAFDPEDMGRRFVAWMRNGAYTPDRDGRFDIGGITATALRWIADGTPVTASGLTHEGSKSNGSLMRILPLALVDRKIGEEVLVRRTQAASAITHANPVPMAACALYVLIARRLLAGERDRVRALAEARVSLERRYSGELRMLAALEELMAWPTREGRGGTCDSFWSAWDAFAGADSYPETTRRAITHGNDTDTTACIAGGLAGLYWGIDGIPADWRDRMRDRAQVAGAVDGLLETEGWRTSTGNPIRLDLVDLARAPGTATWTGRLGMTFLPGKQRDGWTGLHWRDIALDAQRLRSELGVDTFLLLVEDHELRESRVPDAVARLEAEGIEVLRHPIVDMKVPADPAAFRGALDTVIERLQAGRTVAIACRGGLGRTGTAVACLLVDAGLAPKDAIRITRASRPGTIERGSQAAFVMRWPREATTGVTAASGA